jgi:hypothetical protein
MLECVASCAKMGFTLVRQCKAEAELHWPRMRFSVKRAARTSPTTQHSTGNPGERSGAICDKQRLFVLDNRCHTYF